MAPRRLLNSREVGELLGLSNRAVTQRLARPFPSIPLPDFVIDVPGRGEEHGWLPDRTDLVPAKPAVDDPALLGDCPESLPDSFLIGPRQWPHFVGWSVRSVIPQRNEALRRRALGTAEPPTCRGGREAGQLATVGHGHVQGVAGGSQGAPQQRHQRGEGPVSTRPERDRTRIQLRSARRWRLVDLAIAAIAAAVIAADVLTGHIWMAAVPSATFALMAGTALWQTSRIAGFRAQLQRPDYAHIASMEREVYGETFTHDGAPEAQRPPKPHPEKDCLCSKCHATRVHEDRRAADPMSALAWDGERVVTEPAPVQPAPPLPRFWLDPVPARRRLAACAAGKPAPTATSSSTRPHGTGQRTRCCAPSVATTRTPSPASVHGAHGTSPDSTHAASPRYSSAWGCRMAA